MEKVERGVPGKYGRYLVGFRSDKSIVFRLQLAAGRL